MGRGDHSGYEVLFDTQTRIQQMRNPGHAAGYRYIKETLKKVVSIYVQQQPAGGTAVHNQT